MSGTVQMPSRVARTVDLQEPDLVTVGNSRECQPTFRLEGKLCYLGDPFSMMMFSAITWLSYYYLYFAFILVNPLQMPETPLTRSFF